MPTPPISKTLDIALSPQHIQTVRQILCSVLEHSPAYQAGGLGVQAWVFGSRATGHARPYSDLDILVSQPQSLDWRARADLVDAFEASSLPFRVDVVEESRLAPGIAARVLAERLLLL
jgi:uncharacterized protein